MFEDAAEMLIDNLNDYINEDLNDEEIQVMHEPPLEKVVHVPSTESRTTKRQLVLDSSESICGKKDTQRNKKLSHLVIMSLLVMTRPHL